MSGNPGLQQRVHRLLERVTYERARTSAQRQAVYRLRYRAYLQEGAIAANVDEMLVDAYDNHPNTTTYSINIDGALAGTIRLHIVTEDHPHSPSLSAFADVLKPLLAARQVLIDPTRFALDGAAAREHPELPYIALRLPFMAAGYFGASKVLAAVRREHMAFYKRTLRCHEHCAPRDYHQLTKQLGLMMVDYAAEAPNVLARYPFFAARLGEGEALFGEHSPVHSMTSYPADDLAIVSPA